MDNREKKTESASALHVQSGIEPPQSVNQGAIQRLKLSRKRSLLPAEFAEGIRQGNRGILSQAITMIESSRPDHYILAQDIIERCLPFAGESVRIGITGVPGVGKSTFIEALGTYLTARGHKLAVLAIDPSSARSKGSILGDKTRMENLANDPNAFIRPSPSAGSLGGVARKTRESIILCEAAGFDIIFVETVGVGQSEVAVHTMVDFFLLLMLSGAGDELQGIKRGIMEMADGIVINKADGDNIPAATRAQAAYSNALHLFPPAPSGWPPKVDICSAKTGERIDAVWSMVTDYFKHAKDSRYFFRKRKEQDQQILYSFIEQQLLDNFYQSEAVKRILPEVQDAIMHNRLSSYMAAQHLTDAYYRSLKP